MFLIYNENEYKQPFNLSALDRINPNNQYKKHLENETMPTVVCPKQTCGCGLCAPKSMHKESYQKVLFNHVDKKVFSNSMTEDNSKVLQSAK